MTELKDSVGQLQGLFDQVLKMLPEDKQKEVNESFARMSKAKDQAELYKIREEEINKIKNGG